jgi:hypothetical protein
MRRSRKRWNVTLSDTQRWHVREKWKAGGDPSDLAREYHVAPSVIDHEIRTFRREIESRQAGAQASATAKAPPQEPTRGIRCQVCQRVQEYGSGTPSLVPGFLLAKCPRCGKQTPHRKIEASPDRDRQPVTSTQDHAVARRGDPETSHEAAASVTGLRESQAEVLGVIRRRGPMTDEEVLKVLSDRGERPWTPSGARTRRSELVTAGLVKDSGRRKRLPTGRRSILWEAVSR